MQKKDKWRLAASIAPPVVLIAVATIVACADVTPPAAQPVDEWAGAAIEQIQVTTELRLFDQRGRSMRLPGPRPVTTTAVAWPIVDGSSVKEEVAFRKKPIIRYRHDRDTSGSLITLAFLQDSPAAPPKRIYGFRDGVIQFVFSPTYKQRGKHWVRDRLRITAFGKDGKPLAQFDAKRSHEMDQGANMVLAPKDASMAGSELVGDQGSAGGCWWERADLMVKWGAFVAIAGGSLAVAIQACPMSGPATAACIGTVLGSGSAASAAAMLYAAAMEKLADCELREWIRATNPTSGSGGTSSPGTSSGTVNGDLSRLLEVVDTFIAASEAGGASWCTPDGDYCVYYPPQV